MNLLMISGDRSLLQGKQGAFYAMLQEFSTRWDRIDIITPGGGVGGTFFGNVHVHPSPWPLLLQPRWIVKKGSALIAEHKHGVMTVHEYPPFYNGIGAGMLSRRTGVPAAYEIHHLVGEPQPASLTEAVGRMLSRLWLTADLRQAAKVRVVNDDVAQTLAARGTPRERIAVVPSFYLDRGLLHADPSVQKTFDVAFAGRLAANKGLPEVLDAVASLPGVRLLVIGDGDMRLNAERLVQKRGMTGRVTFRGWLPGAADVARAIQTAKVFVMNSKSEGGPRVALEAMALGMPVVATKVGVMPAVIRHGENGLLTTGDPGDVTACIRQLLADDAGRARMGAAAAKILDRFEKKALIGEYASFLQSIAR